MEAEATEDEAVEAGAMDVVMAVVSVLLWDHPSYLKPLMNNIDSSKGYGRGYGRGWGRGWGGYGGW